MGILIDSSILIHIERTEIDIRAYVHRVARKRMSFSPSSQRVSCSTVCIEPPLQRREPGALHSLRVFLPPFPCW